MLDHRLGYCCELDLVASAHEDTATIQAFQSLNCITVYIDIDLVTKIVYLGVNYGVPPICPSCWHLEVCCITFE